MKFIYFNYPEPYIDSNNNGFYDYEVYGEDLGGNGIYDEGEKFEDDNCNNIYDEDENVYIAANSLPTYAEALDQGIITLSGTYTGETIESLDHGLITGEEVLKMV